MKGNKIIHGIALAVALVLFWNCTAEAAPAAYRAGVNVEVVAEGQYINWDGVTNVAQFKGADGNLWFAVDSGTTVKVYKTANGSITPGVTLQKQHPTFGTALCDSSGNFYVVTGETNETDDTTVETVFISKYNSSGTHLGTVGDNGSSSLGYWYGDGFYTKEPFHGGNCDAAISGNILSVHYARLMYNGHQSDSVFSIDIRDLSKVNVGDFYESHSFAQRVQPTDSGFVYVSEGDGYNRTFEIFAVDMDGTSVENVYEGGTFDFWVKDGTLDDYNMYVLNNNFAHMGGIGVLSNGNVALVATSARSLSSAVYSEAEDLFIQIFAPTADLSTAGAYVTSGTRSGLAGPNGRTEVTNYGVKWLTNYGTDYSVENVQVVPTDDHKLVILYELKSKAVSYNNNGNSTTYYDREYYGLYYMVLDESGNVTKSATLFSDNAKLNPCETPVYANGKIWWVGNVEGDELNTLYVFGLDTSKSTAVLTQKPSGKEDLVYNGSAQALVTAGTATGGTVMYALGDGSAAPASSAYSTTIPNATVPGTYYAYYYVKGDATHTDTVPACVTVAVEKQDITMLEGVDGKYLTYNGKPQELVTPGKVSHGTIKYYLGSDYLDEISDSDFSETIPTATDAGNYYIWYKVFGDECYNDLGPRSEGAVIRKASVTIEETPEAKTLYYTGQPQELVTPGKASDGKVLYALSNENWEWPDDSEFSTTIPTGTEVGSYYVAYTAAVDQNHVCESTGIIGLQIYPAEEKPSDDPNPGQEITPSGLPDYIENAHLTWVYSNGKAYWYENGYRQGTLTDTQGILGFGTNRGREIYDSVSNGWYWLDSVYDGAKAEGKEVWIPYVYQDELAAAEDGYGRYAKGINDEETIARMASWSINDEADMSAQVADAIRNHTGKWVRYDENGAMLKGWVTITGDLALCYPDQEGNVYYYDQKTGLMAKGYLTIGGVLHYFDETSGVMQW